MIDSIGEIALAVAATLRDVHPSLGVRVEPKRRADAEPGSDGFLVYGIFDAARQRYEDVIVDFSPLREGALVSVLVERGNGEQMMSERVIRLDSGSSRVASTSSMQEFLDALRAELPPFLATPFDLEGP